MHGLRPPHHGGDNDKRRRRSERRERYSHGDKQDSADGGRLHSLGRKLRRAHKNLPFRLIRPDSCGGRQANTRDVAVYIPVRIRRPA